MTMKRGDLVTAIYDEQRNIVCIGLVLEVRKEKTRKYKTHNLKRDEAKIMWSSEHSPTGWWFVDQLRIVSE
jgi:hypothetical protein